MAKANLYKKSASSSTSTNSQSFGMFKHYLLNTTSLSDSELKSLFTKEDILEIVYTVYQSNSFDSVQRVIDRILSKSHAKIQMQNVQPLNNASTVLNSNVIPLPNSVLKSNVIQIPNTQNANNQYITTEDDIDVYKETKKHMTTGTLLPADTIYNDFGKMCLSYSMLNTPDIIDKLMAYSNKKYKILTNVKEFNIHLKKENIAHLFGFLAMHEIAKLNDDELSRFYVSLKREKGDIYASNIANLIRYNYEDIYMTLINPEVDFKYKDNFIRTAIKTMNIDYLLNSIKMNSFNNLEIWQGKLTKEAKEKNDKKNVETEAYLFLVPLNNCGHVGLVIERNYRKDDKNGKNSNQDYYLKSDIYVSASAYKYLPEKVEQGYTFNKISKINNCVIYDHSSYFNLIDSIKHTRANNSNNWDSLLNNFNNNLNDNIKNVLNKLKAVINKNEISSIITTLMDDIESFASDSNKREKLKSSIIKYFVSYTTKESELEQNNKSKPIVINKDIYEYYLILASHFFADETIFNTILNCILYPPEKIYNDLLDDDKKKMYNPICSDNYSKLNTFFNEVANLIKRIDNKDAFKPLKISEVQHYDFLEYFKDFYEEMKLQLNKLLILINDKEILTDADFYLYLEMIHTYIGITLQFNNYLKHILLVYGDISDFAMKTMLGDRKRYGLVIDELTKVGLLKIGINADLDNLKSISFDEIDNDFKLFSSPIVNYNQANKASNELVNILFKMDVNDKSIVDDLPLHLQSDSDIFYTIFSNDDDFNKYILFKTELNILEQILFCLSDKEYFTDYENELYKYINSLNILLKLDIGDFFNQLSNNEEKGLA